MTLFAANAGSSSSSQIERLKRGVFVASVIRHGGSSSARAMARPASALD
jgi:hypothetical protein